MGYNNCLVVSVPGLDWHKLGRCACLPAKWTNTQLECFCRSDGGSTMKGPISYWLPDGQLIFAYDTQSISRPPWIIAKQGKRGSKRFSDNRVKAITGFHDEGIKRYKTEAEARATLHEYARKHGLKPAY